MDQQFATESLIVTFVEFDAKTPHQNNYCPIRNSQLCKASCMPKSDEIKGKSERRVLESRRRGWDAITMESVLPIFHVEQEKARL